MSTPVAIRRASARDAFAVAALHVQWSREAGLPAEQGYLDRFADAWLARVAEHPFWLAEVENRPLGVAGVRLGSGLPIPGTPGTPRTGDLAFLYVTPAFRRCGIGARLAGEVAAWARAEDVDLACDLRPLGPAAAGIGRRLPRRTDAPARV